MSEKITVEVSAIVDEIGDRLDCIFQIEISQAVWYSMESWERDDYMRRKIWKRLACEYKTTGEDQA